MGYLHIDNLYKNQTIRLFRECYALEKVLASIQAERDELRLACDKLAAEVRQQVEDFGKLRAERDNLLAELVAARRGSAGEDDCCNGDGFCPLCDKGRA